MKEKPCHCCGGSGTELDQAKVGLELRNRRVVRRRSLNETARRMGISGPYLSDLERGRRNWSPALIQRFEKAIEKGQR